MKNVYVADFETRSGEKAAAEGVTWVYGWSICSIYDIENVTIGNTIESFFEYINGLGGCVIYFHNLKFDGGFILDYMMRNDIEHTDMIDGSGNFFYIKYKNKEGRVIEIRDSYKKLPFTVKKIGEDFGTKYKKLQDYNYTEDRLPGYNPTEEEIEYMKNDVRVVAEVLKTMYDEGMDELTIGSSALNYYESTLGCKTMKNNRESFRRAFPSLTDEEDSFIRKSYRGGWCYVKTPGYYENVNGETYDVNSLYPYVMHSKSGFEYPYGRGKYYTGKYETDELYPLYVQRFRCMFWLRDGYLPTVQLKNSFKFGVNEYIEECDEIVELTMTSVDLEIFLEHYDVDCLTWIDGYKYKAIAGMFDSYIDHWGEIKKYNTGAKRQLAKLMLNSLYGKFGTRREGTHKIPEYKDGVVSYKESDVERRKGIYIPVGTFCTAYARSVTIKAAQNNYDAFLYSDTDSIHIIGKAKGIKVDPKELGAWKNESSWNCGAFLRQKTYIEKIEKEDGEAVNPYWKVTCSGMHVDTKNSFIKDIEEGKRDWRDFKTGLEIKGTQLFPKTVKGGVILVESDFSIKA